MKWPGKEERENFEITRFVEAYARLSDGRDFELVAKGERPDYVVKDRQTGEEYGVELTSPYLDDRSVPDVHLSSRGDPVEIKLDSAKLKQYSERLIEAIIGKIRKARVGYAVDRPLILAVYLNKYISIHLGQTELQALVNRHTGLFDAMAPFAEVIFYNLGDGGIFRVRPS